jgi:pimeloyl-ACP methyl ester carboxylesterase
MTDHYFENDLVNLHYYKFGNGPCTMLCFHGYGMHGKQFKILESSLGSKYTFYGFDLFFHKETKLKDQSLASVKKGISKQELAALITEFCKCEGIGRFSVIGYSMGTHFATAIVEELAPMVIEYIVASPSFLKPGALITFFSRCKAGNKILEKLVLDEKKMTGLLRSLNRFNIIDDEGYKILYSEVSTAELRFNFYSCFVYLRFLKTDRPRLLKAIEEQNIKSIFIFGKNDKAFPPNIGKTFIAKLKQAEVVILDEGHEMIKRSFVAALAGLLL